MNITNPEMMITYDDTTGRFVFFEIRSYPPRKKFWVWRLLDISIIKNGASGGGANLSPKEWFGRRTDHDVPSSP